MGRLLEKTKVYFKFPVMIQHGDADTVTPIEGVRKWVRKRVRGNDVVFKEWAQHFHELHNDLGREDILAHLLGWIEERCSMETSRAIP